ncbi:DUF7310 family coiled-coil domain-containing protein [Halosimplex sp. J119]
MSERDLDARLDAVERALTDDETDLSELRASAEEAGDVADFESRLAELESRVDELEAGLQAVRGYAGNVRAVNREVERRASAALAKAETLEAAVDDDGPGARPAQSTDPSANSRPESRTPGNERSERPSDDQRAETGEQQPGSGKRMRAGNRQRPGTDGGDAAGDSEADGESQTEQFIERVRDAL